MLARERRNRISDKVRKEGSVSIEDLISEFKVSRMTIWRDLKDLEEKGILAKVHGGAMRIDRLDPKESEFEIRKKAASKEKRGMAKFAVEKYVQEGDIIFLDGGSTVMELIPYLKFKDVTILTNGLHTLVSASKHLPELNVISCGGILRKPSFTFVGPEAEDFFNHYKADSAFISGTGITLEEGITDPHPLEMQIKKIMCQNANKIIALMDSRKFFKRSLSTLIDINDIEILITNEPINSKEISFLNEIKKLGVKVEFIKT